MVVVLTEVLASRPSLQEELINQLVGPMLNPEIEQALEQLPPSGIPLAIGIIGLLFSGLGGILAAFGALNRIWAVPRRIDLVWVFVCAWSDHAGRRARRCTHRRSVGCPRFDR